MANNTSSDRLYHILKEQDVSVMGFANRIGLPVGGYKQLYSILHEGEQITQDLARHINAVLPQYSIKWLSGKDTTESLQSPCKQYETFEDISNLTPSNRLLYILVEQNSSVMGFANRIGLPVGGYKQLYSILRGKRQISKKLAERINALLPQYSIEWLLGKDTAEPPQSSLRKR